MMLLILAWRNIWRNKRRSVIVLGSVVVGIIAIVISDGLSNGMIRQMLFNQVSSYISHIQIHQDGFNDNKTIQKYIRNGKEIENTLKDNPEIESYSKRVITFGLVSSANSSSGVYIYGVNPELEAEVSKIKSSIIEGQYFGNDERDIVVGKKLAEKLSVEVGDKVVAMANSLEGDIGSDVFRIVGIFETFSSEFDKTTIYVPIKSAQRMLGLRDKFHEFAIITKNYNKVDNITSELKSNLKGNYEILSYKEILPMLVYTMDIYEESMWIINLIIGIALIFGIINTMLMSVFERINELGVLMAVGMKNLRMFLMITLEALVIGIVGTFIGLALGLLIHWPISVSGIDLSLFAEGLTAMGVGAVIYPVLSISNIIITILMIPVITMLGAIYPAYKAIRLEPIYAINYV